jgi:hypothetical protein
MPDDRVKKLFCDNGWGNEDRWRRPHQTHMFECNAFPNPAGNLNGDGETPTAKTYRLNYPAEDTSLHPSSLEPSQWLGVAR